MAKYEVKTYCYVKECPNCEGHIDERVGYITVGINGLNVATHKCSCCGMEYELEEHDFPHTEEVMVKIY